VAESHSHSKALARAIRKYRKNAKKTQARLAEDAHLSAKYIGEVERMEKGISVDTLLQIAKALKMPLRDLVWDVHWDE